MKNHLKNVILFLFCATAAFACCQTEEAQGEETQILACKDCD